MELDFREKRHLTATGSGISPYVLSSLGVLRCVATPTGSGFRPKTANPDVLSTETNDLAVPTSPATDTKRERSPTVPHRPLAPYHLYNESS